MVICKSNDMRVRRRMKRSKQVSEVVVVVIQRIKLRSAKQEKSSTEIYQRKCSY